jgi:hypothetical protein
MAGAPKGNTNAVKSRPWADAINKALCQSRDGKPAKLRALAEKLVDQALEGDMTAMKEMGDRVDGKALASIEVKGDISLSDMTVEALNVRLQELRDAASED